MMAIIYVSHQDVLTITADGSRTNTKSAFVLDENGEAVDLQDWTPPKRLDDVEVVLLRKIGFKKFRLQPDIRRAMLQFLQSYHAKQDNSFDCYAFANMVKGIPEHKASLMLNYWDIQSLPWFVPSGSVVFLLSGQERFHHAAIYLGYGLYISVWGAGGDLEFATLKSMVKDYRAERAVLAISQSNPAST